MEIMRILVFTRPQNKSCQKEGFNTQFHEPLLTDRENVLTSYFCHFGSFGAGGKRVHVNRFQWFNMTQSSQCDTLFRLEETQLRNFLGQIGHHQGSLYDTNPSNAWFFRGKSLKTTSGSHLMTNDPPPPPPHVDAFLHWGLSFHQRPWCKPSNGRGIRLTDN